MGENFGGYCQGVRGGVKFPRGADTPGVEEFPRGDETSGVTPKGNGVPGAKVWGQVGNGNSSSTQDMEGSGNTSRREEMPSGQEPAVPQSPQRGTSEGRRGEARLHRNPDGADGANPEHGTLGRRKYGLLAPQDLAGDPAAADPQDSGDILEDSLETGRTDGRNTGTGERNGRLALLACDQT